MNLLGDQSNDIMSLISEYATQKLAIDLEDAPEATEVMKQDVIQEVLEKIENTAIFKPKNPVKNSMSDLDSESAFSTSDSGELSGDPFGDAPVKSNTTELNDADLNATQADPDIRFNRNQAEQVATKLQAQSVQIQAFVMSKFSEKERRLVMEHLSSESLENIDAVSVDAFPKSNAVFDSIFKVLTKQGPKEAAQDALDGKQDELSDDDFVL